MYFHEEIEAQVILENGILVDIGKAFQHRGSTQWSVEVFFCLPKLGFPWLCSSVSGSPVRAQARVPSRFYATACMCVPRAAREN